MPLPAVNKTVVDGMLLLARQQIGKPYIWGAKGPFQFDCSGLVSWVYRKFGIEPGDGTYQQITKGVAVALADLQPGDLLFFDTVGNVSLGTPEHVGIYAGNGKMINAQSEKDGIREVDFINNSYWRSKYIGARRLFTTDDAAPTVPVPVPAVPSPGEPPNDEQPGTNPPSSTTPVEIPPWLGAIIPPSIWQLLGGLDKIPTDFFERVVIVGTGFWILLAGLLMMGHEQEENIINVAVDAIPAGKAVKGASKVGEAAKVASKVAS